MGRKVIVTGGTGYIGAELVRELLAQGHEVTTFGPSSNAVRVADIAGDITVVRGTPRNGA